MRLGAETDRPEFDNFSWFSMMFGAGIGVGMLTWAVAEPIYHFGNNPRVIGETMAFLNTGRFDRSMTWLEGVMDAVGCPDAECLTGTE